MPRDARLRAQRHALTLIEGKVETLPADIGSFDVATIGRALHWMDRDAALALLDRLVARDGAILICASFSAADGSNPWLDGYNDAAAAWSPAKLWEESGIGTRTHRDLPAFFRGTRLSASPSSSRLRPATTISVHDLTRRALTFSSSSPEALGESADAMLRDVGSVCFRSVATAPSPRPSSRRPRS